MTVKEKDCYCYKCKKEFNHLGIARHRAMHRGKKENCKIMFSTGTIYEYDYAKLKEQENDNTK